MICNWMPKVYWRKSMLILHNKWRNNLRKSHNCNNIKLRVSEVQLWLIVFLLIRNESRNHIEHKTAYLGKKAHSLNNIDSAYSHGHAQ